MGGEKEKESLLSKLTRSSFMTWLKLAANPRHMSEVNILSQSPEVTISNYAGTPQSAWTMSLTLKEKDLERESGYRQLQKFQS